MKCVTGSTESSSSIMILLCHLYSLLTSRHNGFSFGKVRVFRGSSDDLALSPVSKRISVSKFHIPAADVPDQSADAASGGGGEEG